jgi:ribosome maturation factor RimP
VGWLRKDFSSRRAPRRCARALASSVREKVSRSLSTTRVLDICIPLLEPLGYDLVDVETSPKGQVLRLFIDRLDRAPVTLDDCTAATHAVQDPMDAAGVAYERLEVSSPGVDRALTRPAHFARFVGETVVLRLNAAVQGRVQIEAPLTSADAEGFSVELDGQPARIAYGQVRKARLRGVLNWDGLEK